MEKIPDSGNPGHFTALLKNAPSENYFFDPFGIPPISEIIDFLSKPPAVGKVRVPLQGKVRVRVPIKYSTFQIQNIEDQNCGPLCVRLLKEYQTNNFDFEKAVLALV